MSGPDFVFSSALEEPARQLARNSSVDDGVVVDRMRSGKDSYGFDAGRGEYVDLVETGIIDPTKVVRIALENAVSVASVLLLSEATLTEIAQPAPRLDRAALEEVNGGLCPARTQRRRSASKESIRTEVGDLQAPRPAADRLIVSFSRWGPYAA